MADKSRIEWTEATWNPIRAKSKATGDEGWFCVRVSDGCTNCYAASMNKSAHWRGTGYDYTHQNLKHHEIYLHEKTLTQPLRWQRPRMIFVCSMTDLFAEWHTDEMIDRVFAAMMLSPRHTFQVLAKRAERMAAYMNDGQCWERWGYEAEQMHGGPLPCFDEVLDNVWLGVSVEDQKTADERIPHLLRCDAVVRWLSMEPLLGPIALAPGVLGSIAEREFTSGTCPEKPGIDWVVVGGESGHNARPMYLNWARSIVAECHGSGVPVFVKQLGARPTTRENLFTSNGWPPDARYDAHHEYVELNDKKGGDWNEWPEDLRIREYPEVLEPAAPGEGAT